MREKVQAESALSPPALYLTAPMPSPVCAAEAAAPVALPGVAHSLLWLSHRSPEHTSTGLDSAEHVMAPSMTGTASLPASTAALINSWPLSWENTFLGGEKDLMGKHFHFFHSLQGTGEQVALTYPFTPKSTPPCLHPSWDTSPFQAASLHSLLRGHGLTQTTPKHT